MRITIDKIDYYRKIGLIPLYRCGNGKIKFECMKCHKGFIRCTATCCPYCRASNRELDTFLLRLKTNFSVLHVRHYRNGRRYFVVRCKRCGKSLVKPYLFKASTFKCQYCERNTKFEWLKNDMPKSLRLLDFHNLGDGNYKLEIRCLHCNKTFTRTVCGKRRLQNILCPYCHGNISRGELKVSKWLSNHQINYLHGFITNIIYRGRLHFDFWIPRQKIAIEYDGEQHFVPRKFFGGYQSFIGTKSRDAFKNKYCKIHHINLIRIPYYKSVNRVLGAKLKSYAKSRTS